MSAETPPPDLAPAPGPEKPPRPRRDFRSWLPTKTQGLVLIIGLLCVSQAITLVRLHKLAKPMVMTVGVREMTQSYLAKIAANQAMTPEEAAIRTEMFLSVSQDLLRRVSTRSGVLVLARECVLAGEHGDATREIQAQVEAELAKATSRVAVERTAASLPAPVPPGPAR